VIEEENLLAHVRRQGQHLATHLAHWEDEGVVRDARGVGLLQAFDLIQGSSKAQARSLLERGLLVSNIGDATIRLCPPLNVTAAEIEEALDVLGPALGARPPPVRQSA
jgi:4-aminobutyrate aminotransferase-like enzyme